jgi:MerR family transcriptional regulator, repressor of the yfmOP operon
MSSGLRIGQVAELTGTTPRTIRYYEEIGLLPAAPGREPGAHRVYDETDVSRLQELLSLKDVLGISLEELRELAAAETARASLREEWQSGVDDPLRRREILEEAMGHIDRQRELLRHRRSELERLDRELRDRRRRLRARLRSADPAKAAPRARPSA